VVFDGVNDYMTKSGNMGLGSVGYLTMACKVKFNAAGSQRMLGAWNGTNYLIQFWRNTTNLTLQISDYPAVHGIQTWTAATTLFDETTEWTLHVAVSKDGSGSGRAWANGVELTPKTPWVLTPGDIDLSTITGWRIGRSFADSQDLNANLSFLWLAAGATPDYYITDPSKFYNSAVGQPTDVDLGDDGSNPGVVPLIFFGGLQTAADWNAGTNLGTGGDFTMNGDNVTDA